MGIWTSGFTVRGLSGRFVLTGTADDVSRANQNVVYICCVISKKALVAAGLPAVAVYALMWTGVGLHWGWLAAVDHWTLGRFHDVNVANTGWTGFWRAVSDLLGPSALRVLALIGVIVAFIRRRPRIAVFLVASFMTAALMTGVAKFLADRPRPDTALVFAGSTSFPSGHALGITVGVLAFTTVLWPLVAPARRIPVIAIGVALVVLVGLSRVALNVHHPSDVVAGWALGVLCYLLCMAVVPPRVGGDPVTASPSGL